MPAFAAAHDVGCAVAGVDGEAAVGGEAAGEQPVDPDAAGAEFVGEVLDDHRQARAQTVARGQAGEQLARARRQHEGQRAPRARQVGRVAGHRVGRGPRDAQLAEEHRLEREPPGLVVGGHRGAGGRAADADERAVEPLVSGQGRGDDALGGTGVGEVGREAHGVAAAQLVDRLVEGHLVARGDHHVGALLDQRAGAGEAEAT